MRQSAVLAVRDLVCVQRRKDSMTVAVEGASFEVYAGEVRWSCGRVGQRKVDHRAHGHAPD